MLHKGSKLYAAPVGAGIGDMGLDAIDIVMGIEDAFGIQLPDEGLGLKTVGELSQWISRHVETGEPDEVWPMVQKIVAERLNIPLADVHPQSRWVEDLLVD